MCRCIYDKSEHDIFVVQVDIPMLPTKFFNLASVHSDYFIDLVPILRLFFFDFFLGCISFLGDMVAGGKGAIHSIYPAN